MVNTDFLKKPTNLQFPSTTRPGETCYVPKTMPDSGIWQEIDPFDIKLPVFIVQLIIITIITRLLLCICKRLRQPSFVAELLAGLLISPSGIGWPVRDTIFALPRVRVLETLANLGLTYHLFLMGLEMDLTTMSRIGSKPLSIGIGGALSSFTVAALFYYFGIPDFRQHFGFGCMYWGVSLSVTGLPIVAEILADSKLIHSELGRIAMSSALVNDIFSWVLLVIALAITSDHATPYFPLLSAFVFVMFSFFVLRRAIVWVIKRTKNGEDYSEANIFLILIMVLACGLITDVCGLSSMVGAFVFGLIIPQQVLGERFLVVIQGFVSEFLMPLYYATVGLRVHVNTVFQTKSDVLLFVQVVVLSFLPKLVSTLGVSYFYESPVREGVSVAFLMNTKSLTAVMALTLGFDHRALNEKGYAFMVLTILIMTITRSPYIQYLHRPTRRFLPSKHRALQKLKPDAELRILACVHDLQTVPGITTLLRISNPTRRSPLCAFALQLLQLTRHTTALLIVNGGANKSGYESSRRIDGQTDQVIAAFQKLEKENRLLSVHPLTAMSAYATMHEDVCSIAEDKRVTLILLPFHKKQTIHSKMEDMNLAYKDVNDNVLANAPCSVGVLVDRGIGTSSLAVEGDRKTMVHYVAMIYIGGPDDREALAYASRMAGQPNVALTVIRFVPGENAVDVEAHDFVETGNVVMPTTTLNIENEKILDAYYLNDFRYKTTNHYSITYLEKVSNNGAETIAALRSMDEKFDLFVVGRGLGMLSPLKAGLDDWSECPELGSVGDVLVTSDFSSTASVLVMQQYCGMNPGREYGSLTQDSSSDYRTHTSTEPFMRGKVKDEDF